GMALARARDLARDLEALLGHACVELRNQIVRERALDREERPRSDDDDEHQKRDQQLGTERAAHAASVPYAPSRFARYPKPCTVSITSAAVPRLTRSRRTWTSTVRVLISPRISQTCSSSSSRENTRPGSLTSSCNSLYSSGRSWVGAPSMRTSWVTGSSSIG